MYQSLYRTWRPKTFSDMVGQEHVVRTLKNQAQRGHIAHAYIFSGSRGTGKTSAARILAMAINCQNPDHGDPCLACEACQNLMNDTTLDVIEMDAASNSSVNEIRDMLEKVNYPPQFVTYKVYIIDEVHMLSNAAFNALLKTLEEPPKYMVFILATTEMQKIPSTILSRCQRFEFGRIQEADIISRLRVALDGNQKADDEALQLIAFSADGSMRDAWSLMDMCLNDDGDLTELRVREALGSVDKALMFQFVTALQDKNPQTAFRMIQDMHSSGKDVQVFLKDLTSHLRLLISAKLIGTPLKSDRYSQQASEATLNSLTLLLEKTVRAEGELRWLSQPRAVLEVYALSICESGKEADTNSNDSSLRSRIEELEKRLENKQSAKTAAAIPSSSKTSSSPHEGNDIYKAEQKNQNIPASPQEEQTKRIDMPLAAFKPEGRLDELNKRTEEPISIPLSAPNSQSPKQIWNAMLERISKEFPNIYGIMSEGKFGGFKDDTFLLSFSENQQLFIGMLMV
ncbi:MAG: DNA polymerase III subunit gamma/tau, partial [Clostridiales bacterium]|nr:DNA polymerase III subunit gamma/tau [Clostridiales bacterium]